MYRAVTVEALDEGIDVADDALVADLAERARLDDRAPREHQRARRRGSAPQRRGQRGGLDRGRQSSRSRRDGRRQRDFADQQPRGTVVEGRDITTVVFPNATVKVFLTATLKERARRRGEESEASVARRDGMDSTREASPLRQADDALVLDTTGRIGPRSLRRSRNA